MNLNDTYLRIADCFFMNQEYSLSEKYYDKAIAYSLFDGDYAIYKRSVALGLVGKNNTKVKLLKQLTLNCFYCLIPKSEVDRAKRQNPRL